VILMVGKGGVGKTTLSAATGAMAAASGVSTLVVSVDSAHSLGDVFDLRLDGEPTPVAADLWAMHLDGRAEMERTWTDITRWARTVLDVGGDEIGRDDLMLLPGLEQLLALLRLRAIAESNEYGLLVVDCAPSADALRLLSLPHLLDWYIDRLFGPRGLMGGWFLRRVERTLGVQGPDHQTVDAIRRLSGELRSLGRILQDDGTTARVVTVPEPVVVAEACRTAAHLGLFGYSLDAVIVNRWPDVPDSTPWTTAAVSQVDLAFPAVARLRAPALRPPVGVAPLLQLARATYGEQPPAAVLGPGGGVQIVERPGQWTLRVPAPGVVKQDVGVELLDNEQLSVSFGPHRRVFRVPAGPPDRPVAAALRDMWLEVVVG
jgi:arsenite-transporting ATPase